MARNCEKRKKKKAAGKRKGEKTNVGPFLTSLAKKPHAEGRKKEREAKEGKKEWKSFLLEAPTPLDGSREKKKGEIR